MNSSVFVLLKSNENSAFCFRLMDSDKKILLHGDIQPTKSLCIEKIAAVTINVLRDDRFEKIDTHNSYSFLLRSVGGDILARSEEFLSGRERDDMLERVKEEAVGALIEDTVSIHPYI